MLNPKLKSNPRCKNKRNRRNKRIYKYRSLLVAALFSSSSLLPMFPVLAASPTPGTVIDNQATGSFTDPNDGNNEVQIESNVVQVEVAEVAGITISQSALPEEAPSGVSGAGANQGNGDINPDDIIYFTYKITNVGNDPTQFFIPDAPSNVSNGSLSGNIEIIEYDPDGAGATAATDLSGSPVTVPSGGISTGDAAALDLPNGSIPPDGTVTIRVPIKASSTLIDGDKVTVVMGNTNPVGEQNQVYAAGTNDVYTQDNPDGTTGETNGTPINGDATNHRQEASFSQNVPVEVVASPNPPSSPPACDFNTTILDWRNTSPGINSVTPSSFPSQSFTSTGRSYTLSYSGGATGGLPQASQYVEAPDYQVLFLAYTTNSIQDADDSFNVTIDFDSGSVDTLKFSIDDIDNGGISGGAEAFTVIGYNGGSVVTPIVIPQNTTYLRQRSNLDGSVFVDTTSPDDLNYNPSTQSNVDLATADIYFDQPVDRVVVTAQVSPDATAVPELGGWNRHSELAHLWQRLW